MRENVGKTDQKMRMVAGPALVLIGYYGLGGKEGRPLGLLGMIAGLATVESAITRVCPLNTFFGIDSRSREEAAADLIARLDEPTPKEEQAAAQFRR